ncbi:unnamed protein product [Plutella xylostella]|uniref:(diamondback moth) hypothetical protein n=1 Tax=Plutella xylostella TaxID=51655 RepID=A0A8S4FV92_PLUXY|nr:unnamed protein product [Plutella xylostella]
MFVCLVTWSNHKMEYLAAIRQLLESETGGTSCPSCNMPFDKGKKRKLIDTCGHERCYSCMFRNEACPVCARNSHARRPERYTPSPSEPWRTPRLPKPPAPAQTCPTPRTPAGDSSSAPRASGVRSDTDATRRRTTSHCLVSSVISIAVACLAQARPLGSSIDAVYGNIAHSFTYLSLIHAFNSDEDNASRIPRVLNNGLPEEGPRTAAWPSLVFNKIRSLWTAHSSVPQGLNQLTGTTFLSYSALGMTSSYTCLQWQFIFDYPG